jgi:hypothetical protein
MNFRRSAAGEKVPCLEDRIPSMWYHQEVRGEVEMPTEPPLMKWFGHAKEDPDFADYLDELRRSPC